jgi:hypothetical protein
MTDRQSATVVAARTSSARATRMFQPAWSAAAPSASKNASAGILADG